MNAPDPIAQIQRAAIDGAVHIPLELLRASPTNPRKHFDQAHLEQLADSVRKNGVFQPILVRLAADAKRGEPLYEVIAGERRWRASKLAGVKTIPSLVRDMTDFEVLELQVIENIQRDDFHPLEEAEGFAALLRKPDGLHGYTTAEELADRIGKSPRHVYNRLALLKLVPEVRELCWQGKLSPSVALVASALPADNQLRFAEECIRGWGGESLSARAAAARARQSYSTVLAKCGFDIADAQLVPAAGACSTCPKRTAANPDLFTDEPSGTDRCLDYDCFKGKLTAHHAARLAVLRSEGATILSEEEAHKLMPYGPSSLRGAHALDQPCSLAISGKPLRKLLGEDFTNVLVIDKNEHLYEVAREADVKKALKAQGLLKPPAPKPGTKAAEPDALLPKPAKGKQLTPAQIKEARDQAIAERWPALAREQLGKRLLEMEPVVTEGLQRMITTTLVYTSEEDLRTLLSAAGLDTKGMPTYPGQEQVAEVIARASLQQLYALTVLSIAEADPWRLKRNPKAEQPLHEVARELGFDLQPAIDAATAEVQERMKAELEAQQPSAPAARKAPAKKPAKAKTATEAFVDAHTAEVLIGGEPHKVGDRARVRKTATGRKTAKDGREGTIHSVGDDGRVLLKWGDKPHQRGVYEPAELEPVAEAPAASQPPARATELKPTVKYRCPKTGSTWSGRGLQPAWVKAALASGKTLDELLAVAEEQAA